jgi:hypothetical protein
MKRINNLKDLEIAKLKLVARQSELELQVYQDWQALKQSLSLGNIFSQLVSNAKKAFQKSPTPNGLLEQLLFMGLKNSAPFIEKIKNRFSQWFKNK